MPRRFNESSSSSDRTTSHSGNNNRRTPGTRKSSLPTPKSSRRSPKSSRLTPKSSRRTPRRSPPKRNLESKKIVVVSINNQEIEFKYSMLKTIQRLQAYERNMMPKLPFGKVVKEITQDFAQVRYTTEALTALQFSAELYITQLFEISNRCAFHGKRVTVMPKDMNLVLEIKGPSDPGYRKKQS